MKAAILSLSLLLSLVSTAQAATAPAASSFEDPNNVYSEMGTSYSSAKKKLGGCAAAAPGDTTDARMIRADNVTVDSAKNNAFTRAAANSNRSI